MDDQRERATCSLVAAPCSGPAAQRLLLIHGVRHLLTRVVSLVAMARRLLIAVGEAVADSEDLPFGVRELIDAAEAILVMTPALASRLEWLASATDRSPRTGR